MQEIFILTSEEQRLLTRARIRRLKAFTLLCGRVPKIGKMSGKLRRQLEDMRLPLFVVASEDDILGDIATNRLAVLDALIIGDYDKAVELHDQGDILIERVADEYELQS